MYYTSTHLGRGFLLRVNADGYGQLQRPQVLVSVVVHDVAVVWRRGEESVQLLQQDALMVILVHCEHLEHLERPSLTRCQHLEQSSLTRCQHLEQSSLTRKLLG